MLHVVDPRCEGLVTPLGLTRTQPELSWRLEAESGRDWYQTAWQIEAAASPAALAEGRDLLWNSGKTPGDTMHTQWQGIALNSRQNVCWRVRVWDQADRPTPWSDPAQFSIGLLAPSDWHAAWIGAARQASILDFAGLDWFWHSDDFEATADVDAEAWKDRKLPAMIRLFRKPFTIEAGRMIKSARFLIAADNQFQFFLDGRRIASSNWQGDAWQEPQVINLRAYLDAGPHQLAIWTENQADTHAGLLGQLLIEFETGAPLRLPVDHTWLTAPGGDDADDKLDWTLLTYSDATWAPARRIGRLSPELREVFDHSVRGDKEVALLRRGFALERPVASATLYATALGVMDLQLNGHPVSNDTLAPGWTDFNKRVYYRTYDVTALLRQGTNVLGGAVAAGWYGGYLGWKYDAFYGPAPRLKLQLEVQFTDGTQAIIATGGEWQAARGPVWEADLLMGEHYAAAAELGPWTEPGYNYAAWQPVLVDEQANTAPLEAHPGNPVRPIEERPAQAISQPVSGTYIFDLGQNIVGRARLRVAAPTGTRIVLRHGEMLNADGTLYVTNLRRARAIDVYLCRGSEPAAPETWEPRFTFHGFRYVEVTGLPAAPSLETITGIVIHSAIERTGDFACSSPMLNQLFSNIMWGHRDNYLEVPTDCPQRDERLGWTGDAQVFIRTASYLSRIDAFFSKWLVDLSDGQNDAGAYPDIAPYLPGLGFGTPAWGDAGIVCPYMLWQAYGSTEILTRQWDSMVRFMQFLESTSKNLIRPAFGYGDWLCIDADTPKPLIGTAYFAWNCQLMAAMADALGRATEAHAYRALNDKIKVAFAREFVEPDGQLAGHTQTAYVIALHMNLLDETRSREALAHLVSDIRNRDNALSVGFVGISYLCPVLARYGELDLAYTLLNSDRYPSWGYEIKNGATTIWERWNSYTHEHGFGDVRMNSFNHYAFGSIGEWMFEVIGGISAAEPGYRTVHVRPRPGGGLTQARFAYQSCRGLLSTAWRVADGQFHLELTVPPNTTALVELPPSATQAGAPSSPLRVGSGRHQFSVELAAKPAAVALT